MRSVRLFAVIVAAASFACSSSSGTSSNNSNVDGGGSSNNNNTNSGIDSGSSSTSNNDVDSGGSTTVTTDGVAPVIGGCKIFPDDNPWNTRIDDTTKFPVHAMSDTYLANMHTSSEIHPDWGDWSSDMYGIPWESVPGSQALVPVTFDEADQSDPGPYPIPLDARIEGAGSGDAHVLILDTGSCTAYETYSTTLSGSGFACSSGAKFDLTSNALRPDGWTSADAAGLSVFAGLVKLAEVQAGAIHHAIRFSVSKSQQAYIHPATHAAGDSDTTLPPMGLRLRLKASVDTSQFSGASLVVVTALKQYGVILADNGSNWYITGDSDDGWTPLMDDLVSQLGKVHGSDFEAVESGPLSTAGL